MNSAGEKNSVGDTHSAGEKISAGGMHSAGVIPPEARRTQAKKILIFINEDLIRFQFLCFSFFL
jgi:hypothetical protein